MVDVVSVHVHAKLRTTDAEWIDFGKDKELARLSHIGSLPKHPVLIGVRLLMIAGRLPSKKRVHAIASRAREFRVTALEEFFVPGAAEAAFGFEEWSQQRDFV